MKGLKWLILSPMRRLLKEWAACLALILGDIGLGGLFGGGEAAAGELSALALGDALASGAGYAFNLD